MHADTLDQDRHTGTFIAAKDQLIDKAEQTLLILFHHLLIIMVADRIDLLHSC